MVRRVVKPASAVARVVAIALITGIPAALITALLTDALSAAIRMTEPMSPYLRALLPPAGALAVGLLVLRRWPDAGGEGIQSYINGISLRGGSLDTASTMLKFPATIVTLATWGSGGIVGPLARICAGIGSSLTRLILRAVPAAESDDIHIGAVCGFSGAIASIFHSPLGGALFAAEVLHRDSVRYADLLPATLAGTAAYGTSAWLLGRGPIFRFDVPLPELGLAQIAWLIPVAIGAGGAGMLFILAFNRVGRTLQRQRAGRATTVLAASVVPACALLLGAGWIHGAGGIMETLQAGELGRLPVSAPAWWHVPAALLGVIALEIVLTSVTAGSGMSGGLTGPLMIIGAAAGAAMGTIAGAPSGSGFLFACMACGLSAILGAALNVPLAAVVITTALFGTGYIFPAVAGAVPAFIVFKSRTVYEYMTQEQ